MDAVKDSTPHGRRTRFHLSHQNLGTRTHIPRESVQWEKMNGIWRTVSRMGGTHFHLKRGAKMGNGQATISKAAQAADLAQATAIRFSPLASFKSIWHTRSRSTTFENKSATRQARGLLRPTGQAPAGGGGAAGAGAQRRGGSQNGPA